MNVQDKCNSLGHIPLKGFNITACSRCGEILSGDKDVADAPMVVAHVRLTADLRNESVALYTTLCSAVARLAVHESTHDLERLLGRFQDTLESLGVLEEAPPKAEG